MDGFFFFAGVIIGGLAAYSIWHEEFKAKDVVSKGWSKISDVTPGELKNVRVVGHIEVENDSTHPPVWTRIDRL